MYNENFLKIKDEEFKILFYNEENNKGFEKLSSYNSVKLNNKLKEILSTTEIKQSLSNLSPLSRIMTLIFAIEGKKNIDCDIHHQINAIAYIALLELANNFSIGILKRDEFDIIINDIIPHTDAKIINFYHILLKSN